jgi:hypothetical protein
LKNVNDSISSAAARLSAVPYAVGVVDAQQALHFSVGVFPVCHNAQSVKAAVVNPKVLRYGRSRSERDAAIGSHIVEDEVPQEHGNDDDGSEHKNNTGPLRLRSHLRFPMIQHLVERLVATPQLL